MTLATEFADRSPWIFGVLWGVLMVPGMVGSGIIGRRAGRKIAPGDAARSAGIRVFLYWLAVVVAMFLIPAAAGMWNAEDGDQIPRVTIGIVSLAYVLFGIMHRPALAIVERGVRRSVLHSQRPLGRCCYAGVRWIDVGRGGTGRMVDAQEWSQLTDEAIHLNETIHQSTRLRIMTLLVSLARSGPVRLRVHSADTRTDRREPDHPSTQTRRRRLSGHHQRVRRLQAGARGSRRHRWDAVRSPNTYPTCTRRSTGSRPHRSSIRAARGSKVVYDLRSGSITTYGAQTLARTCITSAPSLIRTGLPTVDPRERPAGNEFLSEFQHQARHTLS